MKNIVFIFIFLTISNKSALAQDLKEQPISCQMLKEMYLEDQKYRGAKLDGGSPAEVYNRILDSLKKEQESKKNSANLSNKQNDSLKLLAYTLFKREIKPRYILESNDSIRQLQIEIDIKNTTKLLKIIGEYGWPKLDDYNCKSEVIKITTMFRHAPPNYFNQIRDLIENEKSLNRIPESAYLAIDDHLKGRPGRIKK
ncbi:hypothetical protein E7Z59_07140 [Robertkochia marina]|uniref:Uncharacterized protein n=1 Tax=Robertkochia marina TaxID=1227945 RepID=A0A4S3LZ89_9FLAO|nr:hypothetical protein [Robertkochia marina]THD67430.1 hypothetical protein E7Z59_07140 [Robertkochia marina]TRZ40775.1 hypothetical protein D3A96_15405 [Robertkochia marina]